MLPFDPQRVEKNAREATTPDLLDRVTAFREGMEPEALDIIEAELRRRGVSAADIQQHREKTDHSQRDANGVALRCSFCTAPAVAVRWGWHWLWGKVPLFPRRFRYCKDHDSG